MLNLNCKTVDNQIPKIQTAIAIYLSSISKNGRSNQEAGFSLIESLVAVAVVSVLIVAIAPMVALSNSARVNARRMDQATQAARSYIDAVRGGVIDTTGFPTTGANILVVQQTTANANAQGQYTFESIVAPTAAILSLDSATATTPVRGIRVDANGNGFSINDPQDLFIQPMRSGAATTTDLKAQGFWLAVRVYRADALAGSAALRTGTETSCAASKTPFSSTASITCPIVTMRSQILPTVNASSLNDIKKGIGSTPSP